MTPVCTNCLEPADTCDCEVSCITTRAPRDARWSNPGAPVPRWPGLRRRQPRHACSPEASA